MLEKFIANHASMLLEERGEKKFIQLSKNISKQEVFDLLEVLWKSKLEMAFHDTIHPTISDPGAYFSYSTRKTIGENYWSMTFGNHGWSGGIYHLKKETVAQQVFNLGNKEKLNEIAITHVHFFGHYDIEEEQKSIVKDAEIYAMHN